jgi:hypothetical protein
MTVKEAIQMKEHLEVVVNWYEEEDGLIKEATFHVEQVCIVPPDLKAVRN